jgi:hypothetical protein
MNIQSKIDLMNALIRENRDITIEEYAETLAEIESIERKGASLLFSSPMYLQTASGIRAIEFELTISNQLPKEAINQSNEF